MSQIFITVNHIVHLAARSFVPLLETPYLLSHNYLITLNVLEKARKDKSK